MRPDQTQRTVVTENVAEPTSQIDEDRHHGGDDPQAERPETVNGDPQQHGAPRRTVSQTTPNDSDPYEGPSEASRGAFPDVDRNGAHHGDASRDVSGERGDPVPHPGSLFAGGESEQFQTRWRDLQVAFVDEPRRAVQQADELVGEVLQSLEAQRRELGDRWHHDGQVQTEELRLTLREYRSLFDQLLRV